MSVHEAGIAFDIDGTGWDTVDENYNRITEVWQRLYNEPFPIGFELIKTDVRPHLLTIPDYFSAIFAILDNGGRIPENLPEMVKTYRREEAVKHKDEFFRMRDLRMEDDYNGWLAEQTVYDGFPEAVKEIDGMGIPLWVVSSKNEKTIRSLWESQKLPPPQRVYDNTMVYRELQFSFLLADSKVPKSRMIVYDDAAANLEDARKMGMIPVAAPQGYELLERLAPYQQAFPAQLPGLVKELLSL